VTESDRMDEVFKLVLAGRPDPDARWKDPIDARVHCEAASDTEIIDSVIHWAGGVPEVWAEGAFWRVTGAGYYSWVGA
jgi:hypothetical protein